MPLRSIAYFVVEKRLSPPAAVQQLTCDAFQFVDAAWRVSACI